MNKIAEMIIDDYEEDLTFIVARIWNNRWAIKNYKSEVAELSHYDDKVIREVASVLCDDAELVEFICPVCNENRWFRCIDTGLPLVPKSRILLPWYFPDELGNPSRICLCECCGEWSHLVLVSGLYVSQRALLQEALAQIETTLRQIPLEHLDRPVARHIQAALDSLNSFRIYKEKFGDMGYFIEERREGCKRSRIEHRLSLSVRAQNRLDENGIATVEQLSGLSAQDLMEFRHMTPEVLNEYRTQLATIGLALRGEYPAFNESFERFMELGSPDEREVLTFCREYLRERPSEESDVLAILSTNDDSRVKWAVTRLKRWLTMRQ